MLLNRRTAVEETEREIETILSLVDRAEVGKPFDELAVRQSLGRCISASESVAEIVAPCNAARELMLACVLHPTDLRLRHRFRDSITDLRMMLREVRRTLTTQEWPIDEPSPAPAPSPSPSGNS